MYMASITLEDVKINFWSSIYKQQIQYHLNNDIMYDVMQMHLAYWSTRGPIDLPSAKVVSCRLLNSTNTTRKLVDN